MTCADILVSRVRRIEQKFECNLLVVTALHLILCQVGVCMCVCVCVCVSVCVCVYEYVFMCVYVGESVATIRLQGL